MTDATLNAAAAGLLLHLPRAGTADIFHERRAQNSGDPVLGHEAAQLVRRYSEQREIEQAESSGQPIAFNGGTSQYCRARKKERQQRRILSQ